MYARQTYEDVYIAVAAIDPNRGGSSLHNGDIVKAAKVLGITLTPTKSFDPDDDEGVLRLRWNGRHGRKNRGGHFVALRDGQVFCPTDAMVYPWREYLTLYQARFGTLLKGEA